MDYLAWAGVAAMIVVSVIGGRFALAGQRQQTRTQERVAKVQARTEESRLALDMAIEARDRLDALEAYTDTVMEWWENDHRPRDELRDRVLEIADPEQFHRLPPPTRMPRPTRKTNPTGK